MSSVWPIVGDSLNAWGTMLNNGLAVAHNADGTLKVSGGQIPLGAVPFGLTSGQIYHDVSYFQYNSATHLLTANHTAPMAVGPFTGDPAVFQVATAAFGGMGASILINNTASNGVNNAAALRFKTSSAWASGTYSGDIQCIEVNAAAFTTDMSFRLWAGSGLEVMHLSGGSGGLVGIGGSSAGGRLESISTDNAGSFSMIARNLAGTALMSLQGNYTAGVASAWVVTSDERLKKGVAPIPYDGLAEIRQLNPIVFVYSESEDDAEHLGFSAQELQQVIPHAVVEMDVPLPEGAHRAVDGPTLGIRNDYITPVVVEAIKDLDTMVADLTARVAALEGTP